MTEDHRDDGEARPASAATDAALVARVYDQLRSIAANRLARERPDHTLQATALVNEAFLKLRGDRQLTWEERDSFFRAASEAMRRVLIDHARKKRSQRRGGDAKPQCIDVADLAEHTDVDGITALEQALERLEAEDPRAAKVVHLRFYCGLGVDEVADHLGASPRTIAREWQFARTRLYQLLGDGEPAPPDAGPG